MSSIIYKKEPDYIVYSINVLNNWYIGSTNDLKRRIWEHTSTCHNEMSGNHNKPLYQFIRDAEEKNDFIFDEKAFDIEGLIWGDKETALKVEKEVLLEFKSKGFNTLNCFSPLRTKEELKEERKRYRQSEKGKETQRRYEQSEKRKEYNKEYNKKREQSEKRKAYKKAQNKAYYQANRERILANKK
jgi:predicted GIY-YIG superfamily endonuclease